MNKIIFTIIALVIIGGGFATYNSYYKTERVDLDDIVASSTPNRVQTFTMADVLAHATPSSCYTVVRGNVYDLSTWIAEHPGGDKAILGMCGKDATDAFVKQHGGKEKPEMKIETFQIGILTQ